MTHSTNRITRKRPAYIDPAGEPIKAPAWRNLYFLKDGRSWPGKGIHSTERLARAVAIKSIKDDGDQYNNAIAKGELIKFVIERVSPRIEYYFPEFSHHIQIPAKP